MIYELKTSLDVYRSSIDIILVVGIIVLVTSFILILLLPDYIFPSSFGVFLRISKLTEIDLIQATLIISSFFISMFFYSLAFVLLTLATKEARTNEIPRAAFIKNIKLALPEVYLFFIIWFLLQFSLSVFGYILSINIITLSIIIFFLSYIILLIPYAIIIEELPFEKAVKKVYMFKKELVIYPIIYAIIALIANAIFIFIFSLAFNLEITRWLMLIVNTIFLLPFLIILGANLYFNKFTLSIRKI